ncbi:MAG: M23 family metallopeptidase [Saprospiraceae bacterium]|nr:M23 family metallopeptidase [Saprospiraceae bacterium]
MNFDFKKIKKQLKAHLSKSFLFQLRDEDTFEEIASYKLSFLNVYILISTVLCISGLITLFLIILTPLKNLVPGYGDISYSGEYQTLSKRIQTIEEEIAVRDTYILSLRRILSGNPETVDEVTKDVHFKLENPDPVQKVREDSILRVEFEAGRSSDKRNQGRFFKNLDKQALSVSRKTLEEIEFTCPLKGPVGAGYKPEKGHFGIDIIAAENSPIKAVLNGSVIQSDWSLENGHTIAIQHNDNLVSVYKHNSSLLKKVGSQIKSGEAIAIIGNTGTLTQGPHLHFELWYQGKPINPVDYIRFN